MKSGLSKLFMGLFACVTILLLANINVQADNANISVSTAGGAVGDTVAVNVTVAPDIDATAQIWVSYDTNYLEYLSGGTSGVAGIVSGKLDEIKANESGVLTFNFKLKAAGSTTVNIASNSEVKAKEDSSQLNVSTSNGTVNIEGNTATSNDSTLSGLVVQAVSSNGDKTTVSYTPSFSPDVHEYKADLSSDTTKIVVATTLSDSNATTQVSGTKIDAGDNKTTITVRAQDGSTSEYVVYTTRASETTTSAETTEAGSEAETTDVNRAPKQIDAIGMYLIQDFSMVTIPEGFAEDVANMNGEQIAVLKGIKKELTLVCLSTDIQGTNAKLCIYNEASGAIDLMINVTSKQKIYTIIPTDASYAGPEGYTETQLEVNGEKVKAWVKNPETDFYVVYAMNSDGEKALYVYDKKEETMQRFVEGNKSESVSDEPPAENAEYLAMKKQYDDLAKEYKNDHSKKNKIIILLAGIIVIAILLVLKKKFGGKKEETKTFSYDDLKNSSNKNVKVEDITNKNVEVKPAVKKEIKPEISKDIKSELKATENELAEAIKKELSDSNEIEKNVNTVNDEATSNIEKKSEVVVEKLSDEDNKKVSNPEEGKSVTSKKDDDECILIDLDEEPFEIEFVDLDDHK